MVHHVNTSGHLLVATGLGDAALVISSHHHLSNKTIFVTMVIHKLQEVCFYHIKFFVNNDNYYYL